MPIKQDLNMLKSIATTFFLLIISACYAQNDSLILYTKKACSNCIQSKNQFNKHNIAYKEYPLEDVKNAKAMSAFIRESGYKGRIFLPVIILNSEMLHPGQKKDSAFVNIYLGDAVDTVIALQQSKRISLPITDSKQAEHLEVDSEADCEADLSPIYLVCKNTKDESEAQAYVKELKSKGFTEAGMINYNKFFRVYYKIEYDKTTAQQTLSKNRSTFKMSYALNL